MPFGLPELVIIASLVVLIFGTKKLPELGAGFGKAISNFKKSYNEADAIDITQDSKEAQEKEKNRAANKGADDSAGPDSKV